MAFSDYQFLHNKSFCFNFWQQINFFLMKKMTVFVLKRLNAEKGWKALFYRKIESRFFHLNLKILANLFNLIYYLILTLTLTPQLNPNPNHKPQ